MTISFKNDDMNNLFNNKSVESFYDDAEEICNSHIGDKLGWINESAKIFKNEISQGLKRTLANNIGHIANCEESSKLLIVWAKKFKNKISLEISSKGFEKNVLKDMKNVLSEIEIAFSNLAQTYKNLRKTKRVEKYSIAINNINCAKNIVEDFKKDDILNYKIKSSFVSSNIVLPPRKVSSFSPELMVFEMSNE